MGEPGIVVQPVGEGNFEASVRFLIGWVCDGAAEARAYLADHGEPAGASLIAVRGDDVAGYAAIVWESNFAGFRDRGIPLVHQLAVAGPFRRQGVATLLMDAAEQLARERGVTTLGITVGLFDEYGPAQRLYGRRGYVPDGRGACRAQRPLGKGMQVIMDHDLIMWLTKDLVRLRSAPHLSGRSVCFLSNGQYIRADGARAERSGPFTGVEDYLCCRQDVSVIGPLGLTGEVGAVTVWVVRGGENLRYLPWSDPENIVGIGWSELPKSPLKMTRQEPASRSYRIGRVADPAERREDLPELVAVRSVEWEAREVAARVLGKDLRHALGR